MGETSTTTGVAVGDAVAVGVGVIVGIGSGLGVAVAVGIGRGVAVAVVVGSGSAVGVNVGSGNAVGVNEAGGRTVLIAVGTNVELRTIATVADADAGGDDVVDVISTVFSTGVEFEIVVDAVGVSCFSL